MPTSNKFWAGSAESFNAVVAGMERAQAVAMMGAGAPELPPIWAKADGVAVVDISGSMVSGSAGYGRFFGVLGYDDIRAAVVEAANDPEVKSILLHINSGGGAVAGASDLNKFIAKVNKFKPIASYTDGMMASAAYWIGCATTSITASSTAIVGSLGILSVHTERSAQLKAEGISVTVVRAGKYKALANSVEPLSEAALAEVQGQVNALYDIFMADVAVSRGVSASTVDTQMGQGKEFLGKSALAAGLVDKIATYDQSINDTKKLDKSAGMSNNPSKPKGTNMKANLTEAQLAALAAGATLEAVTANTVTAVITPVAAAAVEPVVTTEPAAVTAAVTSAATTTSEPTALSVVQAQLITANDALVASKVEAATFKAQAEAQKVTHDGLLAIARAAIGKMNVALGGSAETVAALDASSAIAEYSRISEVFTSKFKVGGVAATAQADKKDAVRIAPFQYAMIQAAQGN